MSRLVMNLRNVPEDEADEVRALLQAHDIYYYETRPGPLGISMGAIWLRDEARADEAARLLQAYQEERQQRMREAWDIQRRNGEIETIATRFARHPLRNTLYLAFAAVLLYFMTRPFFLLAA